MRERASGDPPITVAAAVQIFCETRSLLQAVARAFPSDDCLVQFPAPNCVRSRPSSPISPVAFAVLMVDAPAKQAITTIANCVRPRLARACQVNTAIVNRAIFQGHSLPRQPQIPQRSSGIWEIAWRRFRRRTSSGICRGPRDTFQERQSPGGGDFCSSQRHWNPPNDLQSPSPRTINGQIKE